MAHPKFNPKDFYSKIESIGRITMKCTLQTSSKCRDQRILSKLIVLHNMLRSLSLKKWQMLTTGTQKNWALSLRPKEITSTRWHGQRVWASSLGRNAFSLELSTRLNWMRLMRLEGRKNTHSRSIQERGGPLNQPSKLRKARRFLSHVHPISTHRSNSRQTWVCPR